MRRHALSAVNLAVLTITGLTIMSSSHHSVAQDLPPALPATPSAMEQAVLQLEVYINDVSTDLIATFRQNSMGSLLIEPKQLRNVGISPVDSELSGDGWIDLSKLPGVTTRYDEATQSVHFTLPMEARATRVIDVGGNAETSQDDEENVDKPRADKDIGGIVNYSIYGSSGGRTFSDIVDFSGASVLLENRVFGSLGVLSSSQVLSTSQIEEFDSKRLDSYWTYSDEENLTTYRAGDLITGGLSWTRPTRLGGVQIRRNFDLRSDIVTMPLPAFAGSAAVPSTVDVYIDNVKRVSKDVPEGPFSITNLPVVSGAGSARLVVRDVLGRETVTETDFFASGNLLARGLIDFSAELGVARRNYGLGSFDYDERPLGSATFRYGFSDTLTLEGHAEGSQDFYNVGMGGVFSLGTQALASVSGVTSRFGRESGHQIAASVEAEVFDVQFMARSQRAFGEYHDLASVTANVEANRMMAAFMSTRAPKAVDQISASTSLGFDETSLNFTYTQYETFDDRRSRLLGLSASRPFGQNGNAYATAFKDLEDDNSYGIFAGVSWTFGGGISSAASMSSDADGYTFTADVAKAEEQSEGSYGWRVRGSQGGGDNLSASGSYRGSLARVAAGVDHFGNTTQASVQLDGSIAVAGGDVFIGNRIEDAFAVVDAGAPGVDILLENRPMGQTNRRGKILLPNLRSHSANNITLDPSNLPVDARIDRTKQTVTPSDKAASVVSFKVKTEGRVALVTLKDEAGEVIETGSTVTLDDGRAFVVGYDGQAYLDDIADNSRLSVQQPTKHPCSADLAIAATDETRVTVDLTCRGVQP
ncbi:fimbrial assembly protein [Agrobacterium rubi]|nr:fimbrial assembly protein [Agrobacterium rubi]